MRPGALIRAALAGALLLVACREAERPNEPPGFRTDAQYEPPPERQVVAVADGARPDDDYGPRAPGVITGPTGPKDAGRADVARDADTTAPRTCDLLRQDCPGSRNCYPGPAGAYCDTPVVTLPGQPCTAHNECPQRFACIRAAGGAEGWCLELCDTRASICGRSCVPLGGYAPVGYCRL